MTQSTDITKPSSENTLTKLGDASVRLMTAPSQLLYWLTRAGAPAVAGLAGTYLFLICVESYYLALPTAGAAVDAGLDSIEKSMEKGEVSLSQIETVTDRPAFIPKPGINDGASFANIASINGGEFALVFVIALLIQGLQGSYQRGKTPEQAKREYEKAARHHCSEVPPENRIKLVGALHSDYKNAGLAPRRRNGLLIGLSYLVDSGAALASFGPLMIGGFSAFATGAFWAIAAIAGPETCWGWMADRLEDAKAEKSGDEPAPKAGAGMQWCARASPGASGTIRKGIRYGETAG
jgi:hypothetical protein